MSLDDVVKCEMCRRTMRKADSMVMVSKKGRSVLLCRDCQLKYYMRELSDLNPGLDVKLRVSEFSKNIKEGIDGRR